MDKRMEDLAKLKNYTEEIDKDLTMILQSLQWDRKHILQQPAMVTCKYDSNHRILADKLEEHEQKCLYRHNGYTKENILLPAPLDENAGTLVKLSKENIMHIINEAARVEPTFKRVSIVTKGCIQLYHVDIVGSGALEPQSAERLQSAYTADERRAIHDAVVAAAPACHDLADLALPSMCGDNETPKTKTRTEILAELRDMRRRRTKYRVAAKTKKYSDVLRDVIKTQMELFTGAPGEPKPDNNEPTTDTNIQTPEHSNNIQPKTDDRRHDNRPELSRHDRNRSTEYNKRDRSDRDKRFGHKGDDRYDRHQNRDNRQRASSRERRRDTDRHRDDHYSQRDRAKDHYRDRNDRRNNDRHRYEGKPSKVDDHDASRDRSTDTRQTDNYDRRNSDHRYKDRPFEDKRKVEDDHDTSRDKNRESSKEKRHDRRQNVQRQTEIPVQVKREREDRDDMRRNEALNRPHIGEPKDNNIKVENESFHDLSNEERARNLIMKIKQEIEEIDTSRSENQLNNTHENNGQEHKESGTYEKDHYKSSKHHKKSKKKRYDERESSPEDRDKNKKSKKKKKKRSRDRSGEKEAKSSRTKHKHALYNQVYAEISHHGSEINSNK